MRKPPSAERLARIRAELLRDFPDIERGLDPHQAVSHAGEPSKLTHERILEYAATEAYYRAADAWLHAGRMSREERAVWGAHAQGMSITRIWRATRVYRKRCWQIVVQQRERMLRRMFGRGPGRRPKPEGMHRGTRTVAARLLDAEAEALAAVAQRFSLSQNQALRLCIRYAAKGL